MHRFSPSAPPAEEVLANGRSRSRSPSRSRRGKSPLAVAQRHAECPISFEPLVEGRVGVFLDSRGKRVSPHYFKYEAATDWLATGSKLCPMTRKSVASVRLVPSILDDPKAWFAVCDVDGNKSLSRREVVEALKAQLPLDNDALERFLTDEAKWRTWDADGSGSIEFEEIMNKDRGLFAFVVATFQRQRKSKDVPDIRQDRDGWFRHWDEDCSGELDVDEVLRAFTKTFRIDVAMVAQLRECLQAVWPIFDMDGDGTVSQAEFLRPNDGLADTIIATLGIQ